MEKNVINASPKENVTQKLILHSIGSSLQPDTDNCLDELVYT